MSDYQEISEQIRAYVSAKGQFLTDGLPDLAANYANLCREANARLRRCSEYLRKGMRSEAIHLAGCQPNLFQLVESLQIPEQQEWAQICATHGLPIPSSLFVECVEGLKEAYAIEQELQPLLSRHRVLALAHAKLSSRIELLRLLVDADPDNICWIGDIRSLETARIHEMQMETKIALRTKDTSTLNRLVAELNSHPWLCDVPEDLSDTLEDKTNDRGQDFPELRGLASKLKAAYLAKVVSAQALSDCRRWHELTRSANLILPPDLLREANPALAWLAVEKRQNEQTDIKPSEDPSWPRPPNPAPPRRVSVERIILGVLGLLLACAGAVGWFYYYRATHPT